MFSVLMSTHTHTHRSPEADPTRPGNYLPPPPVRCERSPGDELGLLAHLGLEVLPGGGYVPSVRLHHLPVAVVEAADELQQGDGSVLVHVEPVEDALGLGRRHLQLCADGEELVPLDLTRVVHVVGVKEGAQPLLLLCAHPLDGGLRAAASHRQQGVVSAEQRDGPGTADTCRH